MATRFSIETIFKGKDLVSAPLNRISSNIGKMSRRAVGALDKLEHKTENFRRNLNKLAKIGIAGVTTGMLALSVATTDVIKTGTQFEQSLTNAAAKFGGIERGTKAFNQLEEAAKKTGRTTEFTASQSAEALNFLAMAGFSAESAIAALPGVVDLATASNTDLATATDIASDSLGAFNLMSKDSAVLSKNLAQVNDVLAKTTTSSNTSMEQMFETIREGAPVATAAGASIETFAALTGRLADSGIKGSKAGTTLKNMFLKLSAPSKEGASVMRRLGVETRDASGNMLDIVDILEQLNKQTKGLGTAERASVLEAIFGKIPIAGVTNLLAVGADNLRSYREEIQNSEGASRKMAGTMRNTVAGSFKSLGSAIEGIKIELFSMNRGPLKDLLDDTTKWLRTNSPQIIESIQSGVVFTKELITETAKNVGFFLDGLDERWKESSEFLEKDVFGPMFNNFGDEIDWAEGVLFNFMDRVAASPAIAINLATDSWEDNIATMKEAWKSFDDWVVENSVILKMLGAKTQGQANIEAGTRAQAGAGLGFQPAGEGAIRGDFRRRLGIQEEEVDMRALRRQMLSPVERSETIRTQNNTNTSEVIIKDETGKAKANGPLGPGVKLESSGDF